MRVILKESVQGLGDRDDVLSVRDGYGRNFLIPTGKAVIASASAVKVLAEDIRQRTHKLGKIKANAEAIAARLDGVSLVISTKTSSTGTIFGSVTGIQISESLSKLGHSIDRKIILLKEPVKAIGDYECEVRLHREVSVTIPFRVIAEADPVKPAPSVTGVTELAEVSEVSEVSEAPIAEVSEAPAAVVEPEPVVVEAPAAVVEPEPIVEPVESPPSAA
jgi:large subunit ribosomal protein L9